MQKVTLQLQWLHQAQFAGFYIAKEKGYYSNYGIDVDIKMGGPSISSSTEISNGNAEFGTMFLTKALKNVDNGLQFVNIAQQSQKTSILLVAKKNKNINSISSLNGKRIGLWTGDFSEPSVIFLNKNEINAQIIPVSWTINALLKDVVDVMNMMEYNEYHILTSSGVDPKDLTVFRLSELGVEIPEDGIYCQKDYYEAYTSLCHDFAEASMDGWFYALNHEDEAIEIVIRYQKAARLPANIPHQRWMYKKIRESILYSSENFGILSKDVYETASKMMLESKLISRTVPYKEFTGYEKNH